ncbi:stalk domain-containing protein [Gorillibacterium massiliense]|uniref:stalk domain-containing protein n=1 Tax=Gorillibacterium massiliense TaxID=1280390 RepID=UPI0004AC780F|nr:stalk domain-containing protein [Gorillibacterium massiliense]
MTSKPTKEPSALLSTFAGWIAIPLSAALLFGGAAAIPSFGSTAHAEAAIDQSEPTISTLSLLLDGTEITVPGFITDWGTSISYVGIAAIGEKLGLKATWDALTNTVTVTGPRTTIVIDPNKDMRYTYTVNGQKRYEAPSHIIKGRTYVPLKFVLEQFGYNVTYNPKTKQISVVKIHVNELTIGTISLDASTDTYTLLTQYPSISGMADTQVQDKLNEVFKTDAENAFADAKRELSSTENGNPNYEQLYDYKILYNQNGKLSVVLDNYMYTFGAHGRTIRKAHTFDLATGKELTLQEAAGGNPNYKEIINAEVAKVFQAPDFPLLSPFTSISDCQDFFLRGDNVVVFFQQYEYTPYIYNFPEVAIPLAKFK